MVRVFCGQGVLWSGCFASFVVCLNVDQLAQSCQCVWKCTVSFYSFVHVFCEMYSVLLFMCFVKSTMTFCSFVHGFCEMYSVLLFFCSCVL